MLLFIFALTLTFRENAKINDWIHTKLSNCIFIVKPKMTINSAIAR